MNLNTISQLIKDRRTITPAMFTGEKISDELVAQLLENANWAPSHRKTEPWRFRVITDEALERLGNHFEQVYKTHTPAENFSEMKFKKLKTKVLQSSHVIAISMQRDPKERVPEWEEVAAVSCAIQNFWLSVTAAGLGGYWSSPSIMMEHFGAFAPLNEGERCLGFFYLGIPKKDIILNATRGKLEDKVSWFKS